jgi:hypothetical protein
MSIANVAVFGKFVAYAVIRLFLRKIYLFEESFSVIALTHQMDRHIILGKVKNRILFCKMSFTS